MPQMRRERGLMERPHYDITIAPTGHGCRVVKDGQEVQGLYRLEIRAAIQEPTRFEFWQLAEATVSGEAGVVEIRHDCPDCKGHRDEPDTE